MPPSETGTLRVGIDENGLGARLGPLLVTAVLAEVTESGARTLHRLPKRVRKDLDDSKRVVSFGDHDLGEAWARAVCPDASTPSELVSALSRDTTTELMASCPKSTVAQCWTVEGEEFAAKPTLMRRVRGHLTWLADRGVSIRAVRSSVSCVGRMNRDYAAGHNRFVQDLHAMERLILDFRAQSGRDLVVTCGKVGGITDYSKYFGPLSGRLHMTLEQEHARSTYRFVGLGEVAFVKDADGSDPLVMLASIVGKYLRELTMARISRFYTSKNAELAEVSGYHDPITARMVTQTAQLRRRLRISDRCFERTSD
jgi:ribonuclease HII